jgi:hypothetical protein
MTSDKRIAANQANAQKSTGPRTESGKRRARLNARRHDLTGQIHTLSDADRAAFDTFAQGIIESLAPAPGMEFQLAQSIAEDSWRLNRGRAIENNIFAIGQFGEDGNFNTEHQEAHTALSAARTFISDPGSFRLISLYSQRTNRDIQKNLSTLQQLQAVREANRKAELEEAADLMESHLAEGLPYDDLTDRHSGFKGVGFVFSLHQIAAYSKRRNLLQMLKTPKPTAVPNLKKAA